MGGSNPTLRQSQCRGSSYYLNSVSGEVKSNQITHPRKESQRRRNLRGSLLARSLPVGAVLRCSRRRCRPSHCGSIQCRYRDSHTRCEAKLKKKKNKAKLKRTGTLSESSSNSRDEGERSEGSPSPSKLAKCLQQDVLLFCN